jgi:hypothetical protein
MSEKTNIFHYWKTFTTTKDLSLTLKSIEGRQTDSQKES